MGSMSHCIRMINRYRGNYMNYYIYKITNNINNKIYIGVHQTSNLNDGYMGSGKILKRAIEKYGIENFNKEILEFFDTKEEMFKREKEIVNNEFLLREDTYNIRRGGYGGFDYLNKTGLNNSTKTEEQRKRGGLTHKHRMENDVEYREKHRKIVSENFKKAHREGKIKYDTFTGKNHTDEAKKKISETHKNHKRQVGQNNSQYGTFWAYNLETRECKKFKKVSDVPLGFLLGKIENFDEYFAKLNDKENKQKQLIDDQLEKITKYRIIFEYYRDNKVSLRQLADIFGVGRGIYKMFEKYFHDEYIELVKHKPRNSNNEKGRYN